MHKGSDSRGSLGEQGFSLASPLAVGGKTRGGKGRRGSGQCLYKARIGAHIRLEFPSSEGDKDDKCMLNNQNQPTYYNFIHSTYTCILNILYICLSVDIYALYMRLFIYLASAVGRVNKLDAFFRFIIALVGEWNNNKTAAERRQMFLIGSLLARGQQRDRGLGAGGGLRLLQSSFDAQMLVKMIFCTFFQGLPEKLKLKLQAIAAQLQLETASDWLRLCLPLPLHSSLHLQVRHLLRLQSSCPSDFEWHRLTTLGWKDSYGYSCGAATSPGYGCRHATLNEGVGSSRQLIAYAGGVAVEGRHLKLIGSLKFLVAAVASGN